MHSKDACCVLAVSTSFSSEAREKPAYLSGVFLMFSISFVCNAAKGTSEVPTKNKSSLGISYTCSASSGKKPVPYKAFSRTNTGGTVGINPFSDNLSKAHKTRLNSILTKSPNK